MKASELLAKVQAGESVPCNTCGGEIPAEEIGRIAFKLGKLAPRMENAQVGSIVCMQCQRNDPDIKVDPRGPDVKFVSGD
jgi:hypothetical protein